jgi:copper chaperone CopZ
MLNRRNLFYSFVAGLMFSLMFTMTAGLITPALAGEPLTVKIGVEGMTCASCTFATKAALKRLDGVEEAKVSYRDKQASVTYDPDRVTLEQMADAIRQAGFKPILPETNVPLKMLAE